MRWNEQQPKPGETKIVRRFAWVPTPMVRSDDLARLIPTGEVVWLEWYDEVHQWCSLEREWNCIERKLRQDGDHYPSPSEREVLRVLREAGGEVYGLDIVHRAEGPRVGRGTVYPILDKLERVGLVASRVEDETRDKLIPRRLYRLTGRSHA